jgi:hypothetical protein
VNAEQRRLFEDLQRRTIAAEREMERMQWVTDFLGERGVKPGHVARLYNKDGAKEMLRHFAPDLFDTSGEEMKALQRTARHLEDAVKDFRRRIDEGTNAVTAALSAEADDA